MDAVRPRPFARGCRIGAATLVFGVCAILPSTVAGLARTGRTIVPGRGVRNCRVGVSFRRTRAVLGKPTTTTDTYRSYARRGIEIHTIFGRVDSVSFHFKVRGYRPFRGTTAKGIGRTSSLDDVVRAYGPPDRVERAVVSESGAVPVVEETYLPYDALGIGFSFFNEKLAIIRVFERTREPSPDGGLDPRLRIPASIGRSGG